MRRACHNDMLLALFARALAQAPVAVGTCTPVGTSLQLAAFNISNPLGAWTRLNQPSSLYQDNTYGLAPCGAALCLAPISGISGALLSGAELLLPAHNASVPPGAVRIYELTYNYSQAPIDAFALSWLGPWHALGLDWQPSGALPLMAAARFSSGASRNETGDVHLPLLTAMYFDELDFCVQYALNDTACQFLPLRNASASDAPYTPRSISLQWVLNGANLYPSALADPRGLAAYSQQQLLLANANNSVAWQAPTRALLVSYHTNVTITGMTLHTYAATCAPATATPVPSTSPTTASTSSRATMLTVRPATTTATTATTATTTTATTTATTKTTTAATTATSTAPTTSESQPSSQSTAVSSQTTASPTTTATVLTTTTAVTSTTISSSPATNTSAAAVASPRSTKPDSTAVLVAAIVACSVFLLCVTIIAISKLRRAGCWIPIYFRLPQGVRNVCCCLCISSSVEQDSVAAAAMVDVPLPEPRSEPIYDRVMVADGGNYDRVSAIKASAYDSPSSPLN